MSRRVGPKGAGMPPAPIAEVGITLAPEIAIQIGGDPFLRMIEQAAAKGDVATMERMFELRAREQVRGDEKEFNAAMVRVQAKCRNVAANLKNKATNSSYASFDAIHNMVRPLYVAEGFALSFDTAESPIAENVRAVCYVTRGAYTRTYKIDMPCDGKGMKGADVMTKTHAMGAAMSYGNRYNLKNIFAISIGEDDRDGNDPDTITPEQAAEVCAEIAKYGDKAADCEARLLSTQKLESIECIQKKYLQGILTAIKSKQPQ